tara:strand:- start:555 stop:722 length:168 start_codon:yes stop_codon:yes gene_type:complete
MPLIGSAMSQGIGFSDIKKMKKDLSESPTGPFPPAAIRQFVLDIEISLSIYKLSV